MSKIGYEISRNEVLGIVKEYLDRLERDGYIIPDGKKFPNNKPSHNWFTKFLKRHPNISCHILENLVSGRTYMSEDKIKVLIAEDDQFLSNAYKLKLEKEGFEVLRRYRKCVFEVLRWSINKSSEFF